MINPIVGMFDRGTIFYALMCINTYVLISFNVCVVHTFVSLYYACMDVRMYACTYVHVYVWMERMYVCTCVCMDGAYVRTYVWIYIIYGCTEVVLLLRWSYY